MIHRAIATLLAIFILMNLGADEAPTPARPATQATPAPASQPAALRIAVLSNRGQADTLAQWQATAEYLNDRIKGQTFVIVPLRGEQIEEAAKEGGIDFVASHGAQYVELESEYGATRIVTRKMLRQGAVCKYYGAVIFVRADRDDIHSLKDLAGKTFMAFDQRAFGGWWMAWRELKAAGIEPLRDLRSLRFARTTQDDIVQAVRDGDVDAGTTRTEILEQMDAEGKIDLKTFRVLNEQPQSAEAPFLRSTMLYPEWAFAVLPHVPDELSQKVAIALLQMQPTDRAAVNLGAAGWTIPLNYSSVHDCLRELQIGPYAKANKITFREAAGQYGYRVVAAVAALMILGSITAYLIGLNARLAGGSQLGCTHADVHARMIGRLRKSSYAATVTVVIICVLVLVGWSFDIELLKRIVPGFVGMNPMTAVTFIVACAAIQLLRREPVTPQRHTIATVLGAAVSIVGLLKIIAMTGLFDAGVDLLLFRERLSGGMPNAMAPNTALCFFLVGIALMLFDYQTRHNARPAEIISITVGLLATLAIVGYAYGVTSLYGLATYVPMAIHTATSFLLLALAMLFARPDKNWMAIVASDSAGGVLARRVLPASVIIPLLLGSMRILGQRLGLYDIEFGTSLLVVACILFFMMIVWWNASLLYRADIQRRSAEENQRKVQKFLANVVQNLPNMVFVKDAKELRFVEFNRAGELLLGIASKDLIGKNDYDMFPKDQADFFTAVDRGVLQGGKLKIIPEEPIQSARGKRILHTKKIPIVDENGQPEYLLGISEDITELRQAQAALVQAEKLAGLGQMVAGVAHEINNPLSFVSNNVAVLQRDLQAMQELLALYQQSDGALVQSKPELAAKIKELKDRVDIAYTLGNLKELLSRSREGLGRIQQIVKDLRDFARLDTADLQEADINKGIESTLNIIRGLARKQHVQIEFEAGKLPPVHCYPAKINQVVMNLLANAIDATPDNGKVTIRTSAADGTIRIIVSDTGKGIDPAIRDRIFDPFFTTKPPGEGTGLGLSISYGIVQDHGGRIEVDSMVDRGSRFTIHLPIRSGKEALRQ